MNKISIVIPCYRSAKMLDDVVARIDTTLSACNYELILVNDNSPDNTYDVIKNLARKNKKIIGIDLAKNFGQHGAIMAGLHQTTGDIVVCMDDDGQTPPEFVPDLVKAVTQSNFDVAYARYSNKKHSAFRNWGSRVNDFMAKVLIGKPEELFLSSFFVMKRYVVDIILQYQNPYVYLPGLVLRTTNRICNVDVEHREREQGSSGYTFGKLIKLWLNGFTAFSVKPLRIADLFGCIVAGAGFLYLLYTLAMYVLHPSVVMGWNSLMAVMLILGGSIMLMLGMIGEYLGRSYISLNNAPQFVIRSIEKDAEEHDEKN